MSDAKWEIWISFLSRQSLIHWQKAQMWEELVRSSRVSRRPENQVGKAEQPRVVSHVWIGRSWWFWAAKQPKQPCIVHIKGQ